MKPLGRKYYKDKTGGKHPTKIDGKTSSWWEDIVPPNKTADKVANKVRVEDYIDYEYNPLPEDFSDTCFFDGNRDELSLTHEDGVCMLCDWNRMAAKSTGWDDPNFIEWWDYKEYCRGVVK
jgi:hypothetical protein